MEDVTITTCRRDDEAWFIRMNELEIDEYDQSASGTGATLHFQGVPILGSPWFAFPISNQRRSGFLTPTYGMSSTRGVDLSVPYYFNIAPNYDYTLTPRIMTKRGVMMGNQFRFLLPNVEGELNLDYLPNDREYDDDRYGLRFEGEYRRDKLGFKVDYNRVSDDSYISDFSGNIRESSESVLPQEYTLTYDETYWNTFLRVTKNQTLDIEDLDTEPYERVPQFLWRGHTGGLQRVRARNRARSDALSAHPQRLRRRLALRLPSDGELSARRSGLVHHPEGAVPRHVLRPRFARLHQQHDAGHDGPDPES